MATHQLGIELAPKDQDAILAFLDALTGVPPAGYIEKPELPPDGTAMPASPEEGRLLTSQRWAGLGGARGTCRVGPSLTGSSSSSATARAARPRGAGCPRRIRCSANFARRQ
jgi:hypothetical protein